MIPSALLRRFAHDFPKSLRLAGAYVETLASIGPEEHKFAYSYLHPLLQYVFYLLIFVGKGLIEMYPRSRFRYAGLCGLER